MHKQTQYVASPSPSPAPAPVNGAGLLDWFIRQGYSDAASSALAKYGDSPISAMSVVRTPLRPALDFVLNQGTAGDFNNIKNKNDYRTFFHLTLYVTTSAGRVTIEKNAVVTIEPAGDRSTESDIMEVGGGRFTTLNQMVARTQQAMGTRKFFTYSSSHNNCQDFVWGLLDANGLGTPALREFIKQDTRSIFKNSPYFRRLANSVTDLGAALDPVTERAKGVTFGTSYLSPMWTPRRPKWLGGGLGPDRFTEGELLAMKKGELVGLVLKLQG